MITARLPFDLPPENHHIVEIPPEVVGVMIRGSELEQKAIELIIENWQETDLFGLKILRKYGQSAPEKKKLADISKQERDMAIGSMNLMAKVSEETGKELTDVQEAVAKSVSGVIPNWLIPYTVDFQALQEANAGVDSALRLMTIHIQRSIAIWTDELTESLHPIIQQGLVDFASLEHEGIPQKKSPPSVS